MYEYRVFDTVFGMTLIEGTERECREQIWYEWKYGLFAYEEGRFVLQRRPKVTRWEDVE